MGKIKSKKTNMKAADAVWKQVDLDPDLMASDFEGLLAFEEITDYDVFKSAEVKEECILNLKKGSKKKNNLKQLQKTAKKKLIKNANIILTRDGAMSDPITSNEVETSLKKKKKKERKSAELNAPDEIPNDGKVAHGMEAWAGMGISEPLLKALKLKGFTAPTEVQALSIPAAILGRMDILGAAQTGSGKTLAFGLPILEGILIQKELAAKENSEDGSNDDSECVGVYNENLSSHDETETDDNGEFVEDDFDESDEKAEDMGCVRVVDNAIFKLVNDVAKMSKQKPLYALILTPTRELAVQIKKHVMDAAALTGIKVALVVGGLSSQKQERILNYGPEIVVATPGRLWELIQQKHPHFAQIERIRFLAIDETDRMLEKGHFEELSQLLSLLNDNKPEGIRRQNFLFSATLSLVHAPPSYVRRLKKKRKITQLTPEVKLQNIVKQMGLQNPKIVDITQPNCVPKTLREARIICSTEEKDFYLYYFLKLHPGRTLVFCNSIGCVQRLHSLLTLLQCCPYPLHSNLEQRQRLKNLERFTANTKSILVATDVAARGLDVPNVEHVIHYQVPRTAESYVHRSGRTARASEDGLTILLMDGSEVRTYTKIFNTLSRDPILPDFPIEEKYLTKVKDRVKLARQLDSLELQAKRLSSEESWVKKAVTEMDIQLSDDEMPIRSSKGEVDGVKKKAAAFRKRLCVLIEQPLFDPLEHLSKKAFLTAGINSAGRYSATKGPKASAVQALQDALQERKQRKQRNKKSKQSFIHSETSTVQYPDLSQKKNSSQL